MVRYFYQMEVDENTLKPIPQNETKAYQTFENGMINCNGEFRKIEDKFLVNDLRNFTFYKYLGSLPVIHLNIGQPGFFKSVKDVYKVVQAQLKRTIQDHDYIMRVSFSEINAKIMRYQDRFGKIETLLDCDPEDWQKLISVIPNLADLLYQIFQKRVFIFVDEYDAIMNQIYFGDSLLNASGRAEVITFFASLYGSMAKQTASVQQVFMTGILCWRGCEIFSSIDRMNFYTVSGGDAVNFYGMSNAIVYELLTAVGLNYTFATVTKNYNGYNFGKSSPFIEKYNPYAIASFVVAKGISSKMNSWSGSSSVSSMLRYLIRYKQFNTDFLTLVSPGLGIIKIVAQHDDITTLTKEELDGFSEAIRVAKETHESKWGSMKSSNNAERIGFNILLAAGYLTESASFPLDNFEETRFADLKFTYVRVTNEELIKDLLSTYIPIVKRNEYGKCTLEECARWNSVVKSCGDQLAYDLRNDFPNLRNFALAFENVIKNYIPITWQIKGSEPKAYANEAIFETLLTTVINANIVTLPLRRLETQHQFEYVIDKRRPDVVLQCNDKLTIFELKHCKVDELKKKLRNAAIQSLGYAKWYLNGTHANLYQLSSVRVIVLAVTKYKERVVMRTAVLGKSDDFISENWEENLHTIDYQPDLF